MSGLMAMCGVLLVAGTARAATLTVPGTCSTIQACIVAANTGDTVAVAGGTYNENIDFLGKAITVIKLVSLGPAIIDGHLNPGVPTVSFISGETRASSLIGFTITGGSHSAGSGSVKSGGIYVYESAPTIQSNIITANTCYGIYVNNGDALIEFNTISGTVNGGASACTYSGAGIYLNGTYPIGGLSNSSVLNNTIQDNIKGSYVGGIMVNAAEGTLLENNTIDGNKATISAGGVLVQNTRQISIIQNLIYGNTNTATGGGFETAGGMSIQVPGQSVGPFIGVLVNNTITGNTLNASTAGESATELNMSGNLGQYLLVNNIIAGSSSANPALNCSVSGNALSITPLVMDHNDIYNAAGTAYGGACTDTKQLFITDNKSVDPKFVSPATFDFHLQHTLSVVDYGNNSAPQLPAGDLEGNPRIQDAGASTPIVDMGVYEYTGTQGATTVTTLTPSTWTPAANTPFNLTIAVTSSTGTPPAGAFTITRNPFFGTPSVLGANGTLTVQVAGLPAGLYNYVANYSVAPESESTKLYLLVGQTSATSTVTSLTITSAGNPVTTVPAKTAVTLTATVTASGGAPITTGQINFCDASYPYCTDVHLLGTAQLTSAGTATLKFIPNIGTHSYKAVFAGTSAAATGVSANVPLTVTGTYPTTTALVASGSPGNYTLTATVTGSAAIPPTGTVSFQDTTNSNAVLGTASLVAGASTFSVINASTPTTDLKPYGITSGDFNHDGILDLAVANQGDGINPSTATILLGNGDGTFTPAVSPAIGVSPFQIIAADLNSDGNLDLAVANYGSSAVNNGVTLPGSITILLGNGDGTFTPMPDIAAGNTSGVGVGDFNGDGILDLVAADNATGDITLLLGNGDGTFTPGTTLSMGSSAEPEGVIAGDFNNDGALDFAISTLNAADVVYFGAGDGTFLTSTSLIVADGLAAGDFNEDGSLDLALTGIYVNGVDVVLNKGNGTFNTPVKLMTANLFGVGVGDFNGDGHADIATTDFGNSIAHILLGSGTAFTPSLPAPATGASPTEIAVGDFNGDGLADIAITNFQDNSVTVLLSHITTTATATATGIAINGYGTHLADAVYPGSTSYTGSTSNLVPLIAQSTPTVNLTASPEPSTYSSGFTLTATVVPPAASTDTPSGAITFSIDGVQVGAPVTLTAGSASYVVAAGALSVGVHTIAAAYGGDTNFYPATQNGTHTINLDPTTTTLTNAVPANGGIPSTAPQTIYYAQDFSIVGSVQVTGLGPLTGSILFSDNNAVICTLPLTQVSCTTVADNFDAGTHSLTAAYSGDATNGPSTTAAPVVLNILPDTTTMSLITSGTPVYQGQPVTFRSSIIGNYAAPTGTVTYTDTSTGQSTTVPVIPNTNGSNFSQASFTTSTLTVGTHVMQATYTDTGTPVDFDSATSSTLSEVILPAVAVSSTLTLSSSLNPAGFGQTVTFTAAVTLPVGTLPPLPPGVATGSVSFFDGATLLSTSTLDSTGAANFNIANLAVGTHVITAQYAGDSFYLAASSNTVLEVIHVPYTGPADFTLTIAQNPFAVGVGLIRSTQVTVTATNGWTNDVKLSCPTSLPYETTCTLLQTTILGGNGATTLTLSTISPHNCGSPTPYFTGTASLMRFGSAVMAGLVMLILPRRRRVMKGLLLAMLCVLPGMVGCAGNCTDLGTRPQTYSIPITATGVGTSTTHTVDLQLQVNL